MADETGVVVPIRGRVIPPQPSTPPPKPEIESRPQEVDAPAGAKARERLMYRRERDRRIMQMFATGSSPEAIAASFSARAERISVTTVKRVIAAEMKEAAKLRSDLASTALDIELTRLDGLMRRAHAILDAPCGTCSGLGQSTTGGVCRDCRGDGRSAHPDTRLRAMREIRALTESRAKLLGLEAPQRIEMSGPDGDPIRSEVSLMSNDELSRALDDFSAGAEAARALAP